MREQRSQGSDGSEVVRVIIGEVKREMATGGFDQPLQGRYGARPLTRKLMS